MAKEFWYKPLADYGENEPLADYGEINIYARDVVCVWKHKIKYQDDNDRSFPSDGKIHTIFRLFSDGTLVKSTWEYDGVTQDDIYDQREITEDVLATHGVRIPEKIRRTVPSLRRDADESMAEATPQTSAIDQASGTHGVRNRHANEAGRIDEMMAKATPEDPIIVPAANEQGGRMPRRWRLKAVLDANRPYLLLDGKPVSCKKEVAIHFVAKLIEADGHRVAFTEWVKGYPEFAGERSHRVFNALPKSVQELIEHGQGIEPKLKDEALANP